MTEQTCQAGPEGSGRPLNAEAGPAARFKMRSAIEHLFAAEKHRSGLFVRTVGMARAAIKIGVINLVYNFSRLAWLEDKSAPA